MNELTKTDPLLVRWLKHCAWLPAIVFVVVFVPTVLSVPVAKGIDPSMFYSIFHQLAQGRLLYVDIFDMKDPLYFYSYAVAYAMLGLRGPMVWETILSLLLVVGMDCIMVRVGLGVVARLCSLVLFAFLFFTPDVYLPIHTYHQAIVLFVWAVWAGLSMRPLLAGVLLALVFFSKMPMVYVLPAAGWVMVFGGAFPRLKTVLRRTLWSALGFFGTMAVVLVVLVARGEFWGYLDSIGVNVNYSGLYIHKLFAPVTFEKASWLFGYGTMGTWLMLVVLDLSLSLYHMASILYDRARRKMVLHPAHWLRGLDERWHLLYLSAFSMLLSLGVLYTVSIGPKRSHHFQLVPVAVMICLVHLFYYVRTKMPRHDLRITTAVFTLIVAALMVFAPADHHVVQARPEGVWRGDALRFDSRFVPWRDLLARYAVTAETFAVASQSNPGVRLPGLTPPEMRLACRVFFQLPWNYMPMMEDLIACASERRADVFFRQRYFNEMPYYEKRLDAALQRNYTPVETNGEVTIWLVRKDAVAPWKEWRREEEPALLRLGLAARAIITQPLEMLAQMKRHVWRRPCLSALTMHSDGALIEGGTRVRTNTVVIAAKDVHSTNVDWLTDGEQTELGAARLGYARFKFHVAEPCGGRVSVVYGAGQCAPFNVLINDSNTFFNVGAATNEMIAAGTTKEVMVGDVFFSEAGANYVLLQSTTGAFAAVAGVVVRACEVAPTAPRRPGRQ